MTEPPRRIERFKQSVVELDGRIRVVGRGKARRQRVMLISDSRIRCGETVRVYVPTTLRW